MLADLGANDEGGNIEVLFNDRHINYKKKNLFLLNDLTLKEPIAKLEERTTKNKEQVLNLVINADDISSMSSIESENELWQSIENKAINKINVARNQYKDSDSISMTSDMQKPRKNRRQTALMDDRDEIQPGDTLTSDNKVLIEKFEKKMEKLKENHRLEVMTISNSLQAKAKEMVGTKLEEIKIKFESDTRVLMTQLVELKAQLIEKDKQIAQLKEIIKSQEVTLKNAKVGFERSLMGTPQDGRSIEHGHNDDLNNENFNLKYQVEQLKSEVSSMRTLCNAYKKDENLAKKEVREVNIKLQETENKFKEILEERCREYEDRIAELNHQLLLGKRELNKAKMNFELEIKILKALAQKYKDKENLPPVDNKLNNQKSTNKSFSQDRSAKGINNERRNSKKFDKRDNSVSFTDKRSEGPDSGIPSRPDTSDDAVRLASQFGARRKLKKGEYDVDSHNNTFYSKERSSLVTPDSTKYGSFATRPGTSLLDKSKLSHNSSDASEFL